MKGTAVHYFSTSISHKTILAVTGKRDYDTEAIDLFGDITGRSLYHVSSDLDVFTGKLVNSGHQVFSGTIMDSDPVLILDDDFYLTSISIPEKQKAR